jgi:hypothetical protein
MCQEVDSYKMLVQSDDDVRLMLACKLKGINDDHFAFIFPFESIMA